MYYYLHSVSYVIHTIYECVCVCVFLVNLITAFEITDQKRNLMVLPFKKQKLYIFNLTHTHTYRYTKKKTVTFCIEFYSVTGFVFISLCSFSHNKVFNNIKKRFHALIELNTQYNYISCYCQNPFTHIHLVLHSISCQL